MTVSSAQSSLTFQGDGTQIAFPCTFKVFDEAHIQVRVDGVLKVLTTDYTVSGVGGDSFTVTFVTAPANMTEVAVARVVPLLQETDYLENDEFPAETHERALDLLVMMVQQVADSNLGRNVRFPVTDPAALSGLLPPAAERVGKLLTFGSDGEVEVSDATSLGVFSTGTLHNWTAEQVFRLAPGTDAIRVADAGGITKIKLRHNLGGVGVLAYGIDPINEIFTEITADDVDPEGLRSGRPGSLYLRTDGAPGRCFFVKEVGLGTNTGWKGLGASEPVAVALAGSVETVTGIPPRTRKVTIHLNSLSTNGSEAVGIRLGSSAGLATAGYSGVRTETLAGAIASAPTAGDRLIFLGTMSAALIHQHRITITWAALPNFWTIETFGFDSEGRTRWAVGHVSLSGVLDRFQILTAGVNTFDLGSVSYVFE